MVDTANKPVIKIAMTMDQASWLKSRIIAAIKASVSEDDAEKWILLYNDITLSCVLAKVNQAVADAGSSNTKMD